MTLIMKNQSRDDQTKSAIVFAVDETFVALAKGLVLSLRALGLPDDSCDLCLIDIGCSAETQQWMTQQACRIAPLDRTPMASAPPAGGANYMKAQICRPFIPQIFPGYSRYLYLDADTWVQKEDSLDLLLSAARAYPDRIVLAPFVDYSYSFNYVPADQENYLRFLTYFYEWYEASYGAAIANQMKGRALFSSGVFAMTAACPLWKGYADELKTVFSRDYSRNAVALHVAEQTALNHLIYSTGAYVPIEAIHNYHCHVGAIERDHPSGEVVVTYPPRRSVGIVHLSYSSKMMPSYLERGLLWDSGRYLSEQERDGLSRIGHY